MNLLLPRVQSGHRYWKRLRTGLDFADYTGADTWRRVRSIYISVSEIKVERRSPIE